MILEVLLVRIQVSRIVEMWINGLAITAVSGIEGFSR